MTDQSNVYRVDPRLARILALGIDRDLPNHVEEWHRLLLDGKATGAMVDIFVGLGWLSSARDPRIELLIGGTPALHASAKVEGTPLPLLPEDVTINEPGGEVAEEETPEERADREASSVPPEVDAMLQRRAAEDAEAATVISEPVSPKRRKG